MVPEALSIPPPPGGGVHPRGDGASQLSGDHCRRTLAPAPPDRSGGGSGLWGWHQDPQRGLSPTGEQKNGSGQNPQSWGPCDTCPRGSSAHRCPSTNRIAAPRLWTCRAAPSRQGPVHLRNREVEPREDLPQEPAATPPTGPALEGPTRGSTHHWGPGLVVPPASGEGHARLQSCSLCPSAGDRPAQTAACGGAARTDRSLAGEEGWGPQVPGAKVTTWTEVPGQGSSPAPFLGSRSIPDPGGPLPHSCTTAPGWDPQGGSLCRPRHLGAGCASWGPRQRGGRVESPGLPGRRSSCSPAGPG